LCVQAVSSPQFHRAGLGREGVADRENGYPDRVSEVWRYHAPVLSPSAHGAAATGWGRPSGQASVEHEAKARALETRAVLVEPQDAAEAEHADQRGWQRPNPDRHPDDDHQERHETCNTPGQNIAGRQPGPGGYKIM